LKKILFIFGTRPEAIKLAPVINNMYFSKKIQPIVCVTAQHREMLDQVLNIFSIIPKYDLDIMKKNQSLFDITANSLVSIKKVIENELPDMLIVQGDTTTTFVGALSGFYKKVAVAHVEAGLRTFNKLNPYPEEINRVLTAQLADLHFAPTKTSYDNLIREGVNKKRVFITGNTVIDAFLYISKKLKLVPLKDKKMILVTSHRRESFGKKIRNICFALKEIAQKYQDWQLIYPVHLNPNIQKPVKEIISGMSNIKLLAPLDYIEFVKLMHQAYLILTDSGGVQEEAPAIGKPVLVMRDDTERHESIESGNARLVGTDRRKIVEEVSELIEDKKKYREMCRIAKPYGEGEASKKIIDIIERFNFQ